jgi:hypothetical protein
MAPGSPTFLPIGCHDRDLLSAITHVHDLVSASSPLARGRPPLLAVRWPRATGLTSDLSGCLWLTSQRCVVSRIAGVLEG